MNYISPRISIVDGTHLCLLPSSNNVSNGNVGDGSSEKIHHKQTRVANDDVHHINEGQTINIPAVPLSSTCDIYNGEYISCSSGGDTTGDIRIDSEDIATSSSSDKNNLLNELPIETIQIQTSDISNAQYRFIHSTSLINNNGSTNYLPLRIAVSDDLEEGEVSVNHKQVKVTLPSFTTSDEHEVTTQYRNEDVCKVYGGEYYDITNDDRNDDNMMNSTQNSSGNKSHQLFEVQGAGSCLVADFLGIVGYQQALILPQVSADSLSKLGSTVGSDDDESVQEQKELLQMILRHSFLTDGMGLLLPRSYANNTHRTTTRTEDDKSMMSLTMTPLERLDEDLVDAEESPDGGGGGSEQLIQEGDAAAQHPSKSNSTASDTQPTGTCNNTEPQEDPEWLKRIAQTVEHRLSKQVEESNQIMICTSSY